MVRRWIRDSLSYAEVYPGDVERVLKLLKEIEQ